MCELLSSKLTDKLMRSEDVDNMDFTKRCGYHGLQTAGSSFTYIYLKRHRSCIYLIPFYHEQLLNKGISRQKDFIDTYGKIVCFYK